MAFMDYISSNTVSTSALNLSLSITPARKSNYTFQWQSKKNPIKKCLNRHYSSINSPSTNVNLWDRNMDFNIVTSGKGERLFKESANTVRRESTR